MNNLRKAVLILNEFDIYYPGSINSYSYLIGDPAVYVTISEFYSMLNTSKILGISNIYLTGNLDIISIGYYGFSVNDIRSNS
jgi:hypothetical protein